MAVVGRRGRQGQIGGGRNRGERLRNVEEKGGSKVSQDNTRESPVWLDIDFGTRRTSSSSSSGMVWCGGDWGRMDGWASGWPVGGFHPAVHTSTRTRRCAQTRFRHIQTRVKPGLKHTATNGRLRVRERACTVVAPTGTRCPPN